ncbi:MAG: hypothetical protein QOJ46_1700 [bacterium]|jgi:hypothetical protein
MQATTTSKPCVFISYRRDDAGGWAGRMEDDLADRFGSERVFRDIRIPPGVDYEQHIEGVLDACHVVVVVIGPEWATLKGDDGVLRLAQSDDLLRREIERALARRDVEVIPVLVQRARMPGTHELPPALQALARRQAIELSDSRWNHDMGQLIAQLCEVLEGTTAVNATLPRPQGAATPAPSPAPEPAPSRRAQRSSGRPDPLDPRTLTSTQRLVAAAAIVVAGGLGVLVASLFNSGFAERRGIGAPPTDRIVYFAAERGVMGAFVGAFVLAAVALTLRRDRTGALGCAIVGLGAGVVGGALGGAAYMVLKDQDIVASEELLRAIAAALPAVVVGAAVARVVSGQRSIYMLAGLAGGLVGGILAQSIIGDSGPPRGVSKVLFETIVAMAALAAVATTASPAFAGRRRLAKT